MRNVLQRPVRSIVSLLSLAGALIVFVVVILPVTALGGRPSGKNEVWNYTNDKGNVLKSVGEDQLFNINGKNLDHAVDVFCWSTAGHFSTVSNWDYGATSKQLINVDAHSHCDGPKMPIQVQFDNGTPGDTTDDVFVSGPALAIKPRD